jgi:methionyl-tRNA formyltransferase
MRIVFFGTPELAVPSVNAVAERHDVVAVVCQPDRPKGRGKKVVPPPVKVWAEAHGVEIHQPTKLNDGAFASWLREKAPDVCAIAAYGRLLKEPILTIPAHGFVNMHPSLLPKYRGPSPIQSALLNGESETGVTIMRLVLEMDAGDVMLQETVPICDDDNGITLTASLAQRGGAMLAAAIDLIAAGRATFTPQDHEKAVHCAKFTKESGRISWGKSAQQIHNLVRAALPWPVAQCRFRGEVYRLHGATVESGSPDAPPGTVVAVEKDCIRVATGDGSLAITSIQAPGKRAMDTADFLRGHNVTAGEQFEEF